MMGFKLCPKCKGDLFLNREHYGYSVACLQCGYRMYLGEVDDYQTANSLAHMLLNLRNTYKSHVETRERVGVDVS